MLHDSSSQVAAKGRVRTILLPGALSLAVSYGNELVLAIVDHKRASAGKHGKSTPSASFDVVTRCKGRWQIQRSSYFPTGEQNTGLTAKPANVYKIKYNLFAIQRNPELFSP
jgi:hypothetical protein